MGGITADKKRFAIGCDLSVRNTFVVLLQVQCLNDRTHVGIAQGTGCCSRQWGSVGDQ